MPRRPCVRDPIGLNRENAAAYVGVSPGLFDAMVADGRMPPPRAAGARKIWHAGELEQALLSLPAIGEAPGPDGAGVDKCRGTPLWS